jgi:hypothetical protein
MAVVDDSLVSRARNTLVAKFLESRAEPLLFVDADIGFDPLQIVAMLNFGQEFVAGVAPVKDYFPDGCAMLRPRAPRLSETPVAVLSPPSASVAALCCSKGRFSSR